MFKGMMNARRQRVLADAVKGRRRPGSHTMCSPIEPLEPRCLLSAGVMLTTAENLGTLGSSGLTASGTFSTTNTTDIYKFTVPSIAYVTISTNNDIRIARELIQDKNGNGLVDSVEIIDDSAGGAVDMRLAAGTYFVCVTYPSATINYSYTLTLGSMSAPADVGGTMATAKNLGSLTGPISYDGWVGATDSTDMYKFTVPSTADVTVSTDNRFVALAFIWDRNGNGLIDSDEVLDYPDHGTHNMRFAAGNYYVRATSDYGSFPYTLTLGTTLAPADVGNTLATAKNLGSLTGPISYDDWVGATDSTDVYKFTVPSLADVTIYTSLPYYSGPYDYHLRQELIWDKNGNGLVDSGEVLTSAAVGTMNMRLAAGSYYVRVTNDQGVNNPYTLTLGASIAPAAPSNIALSKMTISENQSAGTVVGTLSATDPNPGESFTYALVTGNGSADNGSFVISGDQLTTNAAFNYAVKNTYSIRVQVTDQTQLSYIKVLTIGVTPINKRPTSLAISANKVAENMTAGTMVGNLSTVDPDLGNTFTYTLADGGVDNAAFKLTAGGRLKINQAFDFETKSRYSILVRSTDQGGLFCEQAITIKVTDVNEAPTAVTLTNSTVLQRLPAGTLVGKLIGTDRDAGSTLTYTLVPGGGSRDNAMFSIMGVRLRTAGVFKYATKSVYKIRVRVTDQNNLWFEQAMVVGVTR